ncbi:MAG: RNA polymerase sigma factor region1.1 domain-containing protein, partial [Desulfobacteraceae bacterium]
MAKKTKLGSKADSASKDSTKNTKKTDKARLTTASAGKDSKVKNGDKGINEKAAKTLIAQGKKNGFLSYGEINDALPDEMLSADKIDETLTMFEDLGIDIVDEKNKKVAKSKTKPPAAANKKDDSSISDYGSVTDPVKMYLREMGMVTLLSREGEVEIAKKIEAGEQDVLKALLETTLGVEYLLTLGQRIESSVLRPK